MPVSVLGIGYATAPKKLFLKTHATFHISLHLCIKRYAMKKVLQFLSCTLFIVTIFPSCSKDGEEIQFWNATVKGTGLDCSYAYLLQFEKPLTIGPYSDENVFYEKNLPEEFKVVGKQITVEYRKPKESELMLCTTLGPSYGLVYILSARER